MIELGTDLIKPDELGIVALAPGGESQELLKEALGGEPLALGDFPRIKWPTGGGLKFERTVLGNTEYVDAVTGVIVHQGMSRSYWKSPDPVEGTPPDCISPDAEFGYGEPGDKLRAQTPALGCGDCPMSKFGSAPPGRDGSESNAQACKLMRDVFVLVQGGGILPVAISIPPGSLKKGKGYFVELAEFGIRYYTVLTTLSLEKATAANGTAYAQARFKMAGRLDDGTVEQVAAYREHMLPSFKRVMRDADADVNDVDGSAEPDDGDK